MITCEHFIYTTAKIKDRTGYQVIAKSAGINDETLVTLADYLYPLGVNPSEFDTAKSLLILNDKVFYSIIKTGVGYDGRIGTLYNHTLVLDVENFKKLCYDSRILDEYFIDDKSLRGELNPLQLETKKIPISYDSLKAVKFEIFANFIGAILKQKNIALIMTGNQIIQNFMVSLPISLRLISFSTLVYQPDRQNKYRIIQIPEQAKLVLEPNYILMDLYEKDGFLTQADNFFRNSVNYLAELILNNDEDKLSRIYEYFDKIHSLDYENKLILLEYIFGKEMFNIALEDHLSKLEDSIKKIYTDPNFGTTDPHAILFITKSIRLKIQNELNNSLTNNTKHDAKIINKMKIVRIVDVLLNSIYDLNAYKIKDNVGLHNEVMDEVNELEKMVEKIYGYEKNLPLFNPYAVFRDMYESAASWWFSK